MVSEEEEEEECIECGGPCNCCGQLEDDGFAEEEEEEEEEEEDEIGLVTLHLLIYFCLPAAKMVKLYCIFFFSSPCHPARPA